MNLKTRPIQNKSANTRKTGPIREKSANMNMMPFNVLFHKKMTAMFSSASPHINCSCICNICLTAVAFIELEIIVNR